MKQNHLNLFLVLPLLLFPVLGCSNVAKNGETGSRPGDANRPAKLTSYSIKGIKFAWYKVPAGLKGDELIATAQKIHEDEVSGSIAATVSGLLDKGELLVVVTHLVWVSIFLLAFQCARSSRCYWCFTCRIFYNSGGKSLSL